MERNLQRMKKQTENTRTAIADKPVWDADMDYWLNNSLTVASNPFYKSSQGLKSYSVSGQIEEEPWLNEPFTPAEEAAISGSIANPVPWE